MNGEELYFGKKEVVKQPCEVPLRAVVQRFGDDR
jgi:hypothetical protein